MMLMLGALVGKQLDSRRYQRTVHDPKVVNQPEKAEQHVHVMYNTRRHDVKF